MSFTIKCNKCGSERVLVNGSKKYEESVSLDVFVTGSYMGDNVESIDIDCEKPGCQNSIEIKY